MGSIKCENISPGQFCLGLEGLAWGGGKRVPGPWQPSSHKHPLEDSSSGAAVKGLKIEQGRDGRVGRGGERFRVGKAEHKAFSCTST